MDPALKPRVVHRGLEGLPDIPDGETNQVAPRLISYGVFTPILHQVDHLCFVVHGIGAACDIKFRPIAEVSQTILLVIEVKLQKVNRQVVDGFRELGEEISSRHFSGARLASTANRVEFLPVNWHDKLHGEDTGTDSRIQPLTLRLQSLSTRQDYYH